MNLANYTVIFIITLVLSVCFTVIIKKIAQKAQIVDQPDKNRKKHKKPTPLLGGVAIFMAFFIVLFFLLDHVVAGQLVAGQWLGVFAGALILMFGGFLDDKYSLKPKYQLIFPILAALAVIAGGVNIEKITNPFGGYIYLDRLKIPLLALGSRVYSLAVFSDLLIFIWLLGMMYTTKLLDGVDGLVAGVTSIGSLIIFLFTMTTRYYQPDIGLAALILFAATLGFLIFNWHPAKIFLGEGGSLFLGFTLGVLAIISGGKFAIALLIMGLPILDIFWTIIRRLRSGQGLFQGDRKHLHFRILDMGAGQRNTVFVYLIFSLTFGLSALFLQSFGKVITLVILVIFMAIIIFGLNYIDKHNPNEKI